MESTPQGLSFEAHDDPDGRFLSASVSTRAEWRQHSEEFGEGLLVDRDQSGAVLGIEIHDLTTRTPLLFEQALRHTGLEDHPALRQFKSQLKSAA